ncbi:uroporphyrinogen-III C-methyltransferase [Hydrogenophaga sp.]|uniref:uroporphyrinogen-III C-methyltransferase n=1 Tax=Hydrogenophaga sp. TaxID=1904254 RepID=UPI00272FCBC7|nr:uroporphyrinogen-III C-methyltransferase [Hydrogenophaga sp.]MDP2018159.1 uroporphyrinogen-III C-methyltransferase [Hydrogenophaga sp.]MDP3166461.1 uroporphyrinogen-III C-methyltransferase [Hydrogenophaga sp.]MDP3810008.1 uroporphyrinogen-III C-methyltransferase [Hydrogenophaga sp.]
MSSNQPVHPSTDTAAPAVAPSLAAPPPSSAVVRRPGSGLTWLALLLAALALVLAGLLWQKLSFTQQELARRAQDSGEQAVEARTMATQAEALAQELQARLAVAEVRLSEVSLQRSQLEELMLALSRSRDDNLVQDLESAVKLAQQQAQLTGSAQPIVSALQAADQRIARAAQPRLNPVQRAIARDIERIQAAPLADIPALALRLDELARQVDEWPVLNQVGLQKAAPAARKAAVGPVPPAAKSPATSPAATTEPAPTAQEPALESEAVAEAGGFSQGWTRVSGWWSALWERTWAEVTRSGRELVRVSRIDRPEAALLAPEQAFFLRENIKLKLLNARLGLLARHMAASQADVVAVEASIARYFDTSAPRVASAQALLGRLRRDLVDSELPRPDATLAALAAAAGGR